VGTGSMAEVETQFQGLDFGMLDLQRANTCGCASASCQLIMPCGLIVKAMAAP
jgi:hypothetical protein